MIAAVSWADWFVLALSVVLVAIAGSWFARRQKSTERYFVGGRSVPGWAAGLSLFASSISTITFVAYPGQGFGGDWTLLLPGFMLPIVVAFVAFRILPFYRRYVRMSAYEYIERRFGYPARAYVAGSYLLLNLFRLGFVLFLSAKALHTLTDWDIRTVILISGAITIAYTVAGGLDAVIWTDVIQSIILLAGGLICVVFLLLAPEGGPTTVLRTAWDAGKFRLADPSWDWTRPTMVVMILYGIFSYAVGYTTTQDTAQRYLATPTLRSAQRGLWLGALSCVATWTLFTFIGTLLYGYYQSRPGQLPAAVAADQEAVFPHFVMTEFRGGAVGLVLAAMVAAAMSTLSSVMNSMAMVTVCDFADRFWPGRSDRQQLILGKLTAGLWGAAGTVAALSMIQVEQALKFSYTAWSILAGGILGIFMLAFVVRRAHAAGVYVGVIAGILVTAWGTLGELGKLGLPLPALLRQWPFPFHSYLVVVWANVVSFGVGWMASVVLPSPVGQGAPPPTLWDLSRSHEPQGEDLPGGQGDRDAVS